MTGLTARKPVDIEVLTALVGQSQKKEGVKAVNPPTVRLNMLAMKLGLVANYTHAISGSHQQIQEPIELPQSNYTSFMSSDYRPFRYPVYPVSGFPSEFGNTPRQFFRSVRMVSLVCLARIERSNFLSSIYHCVDLLIKSINIQNKLAWHISVAWGL